MSYSFLDQAIRLFIIAATIIYALADARAQSDPIRENPALAIPPGQMQNADPVAKNALPMGPLGDSKTSLNTSAPTNGNSGTSTAGNGNATGGNTGQGTSGNGNMVSGAGGASGNPESSE